MARSLLVRHFRQIVVWPLQLMPLRRGEQVQRHWEALETIAGGQSLAARSSTSSGRIRRISRSGTTRSS